MQSYGVHTPALEGEIMDTNLPASTLFLYLTVEIAIILFVLTVGHWVRD
jgi:hypothetical protein